MLITDFPFQSFSSSDLILIAGFCASEKKFQFYMEKNSFFNLQFVFINMVFNIKTNGYSNTSAHANPNKNVRIMSLRIESI